MTTQNEAQHGFWNDGPGGQAWSARADDLDRMMESVTRLLVDALAPRPGMRVLDVGCGAGASSLAVAARIAPGGAVTGMDFARPLLALARRRADEQGLANVRFLEADAQTVALPRAFDAVVSRFGVMFFEDPVAAFANLLSGLEPRGRLVFVAWGPAALNPWFSGPAAAVAAQFGPIPPSPPGAPGPLAFAETGRVLDILSRAGFTQCRAEARPLELFHPGGRDVALGLARVIGPIPSFLREHGGTSEDIEAILSHLAGSFSRYAGPDGIRLPATINLFEAEAT
jgi:SAM-dependent methyltransferase